MLPIVRKIHTYAGLLAFCGLLIYGITSLAAALRTPGPRTVPLIATYERDFAGPPDPESICRALGLTLALPLNPLAIQHDRDGRLLLDLWHANGHHRVTVLAAKLHVEEYRVSTPRFVDVLHTTTAIFRSGDWRMTAWSWYNEAALWSLFVMVATGLWLSRWWKQVNIRCLHGYTAWALLPATLLFAFSAAQIAHRGKWIVWVNDLHRHSPRWLSAVTGLGLLLLGATGIYLWFLNRRERRAGTALLLIGLGVPAGLLLSMRLG